MERVVLCLSRARKFQVKMNLIQEALHHVQSFLQKLSQVSTVTLGNNDTDGAWKWKPLLGLGVGMGGGIAYRSSG